jgi:hypothetical protein
MRSENLLARGGFLGTAPVAGHGSLRHQAKRSGRAPQASPLLRALAAWGAPKTRHDASAGVCQGRHAARGPSLRQAVHEELAVVLPVVEGTARRRHELVAPVHARGGRCDPRRPPGQDGRVPPAGPAAALRVPGATRLARPGPTGGGRVGAQRPPQLAGRHAAGQRLSGGASGPVWLRRIGARRLPLAPSWASGRRHRRGPRGGQACLCAGVDGRAMRLPHRRHRW